MLLLKNIMKNLLLLQEEILKILWKKLPDWMTDKQRKTEVKQLLTELSTGKKIENLTGIDSKSLWVLKNKCKYFTFMELLNDSVRELVRGSVRGSVRELVRDSVRELVRGPFSDYSSPNSYIVSPKIDHAFRTSSIKQGIEAVKSIYVMRGNSPKNTHVTLKANELLPILIKEKVLSA